MKIPKIIFKDLFQGGNGAILWAG